MTERRDYRLWHRAYDDPDSGLSWRLQVVRSYLHAALDERPGRIGLLSLCSGDGRDVIRVLSERDDADRVHATLVELDPVIAETARTTAGTAGLAHVDVITADAGDPRVFAASVPADIVLLVGIFGNISDSDLFRTIAASPQFCRPGAAVIWSRGRDRTDRNDAVRAAFTAAGFTEQAYDAHEADGRPALGMVRYDGGPVPLQPDGALFTFIR